MEKSRRYIEKENKKIGGRGIYIINLVVKLIGIFYILL